ncbi:MAG: hypothetical protein L3J22_07175 [Xanthomonadales bacterium]|nr:hypothetical protein [Xanthomonadales bacterium]
MKDINKDLKKMNQQTFDDAIEELLAGDMDMQQAERLKQASASDQAMASTIIDAWALRKGLDELEIESVSATLEARLLAIPDQSQSQTRNNRFAWLNPANWQTGQSWAIGSALAMSLIIAIGINSQPNRAEILQAREDIRIALAYLGKSLNQADQLTRDELNQQMHKILAGQAPLRQPYRDIDNPVKIENIDL